MGKTSNAQSQGASGGNNDAKKKGDSTGSFSPEKTANWPGNPGPTQPKDRGPGTPKIKQAMMEEV